MINYVMQNCTTVKPREGPPTERLKCHNKHCHRFGSAEFYIGLIQKNSYSQNHIAFYNGYILSTMFHRSAELKIAIDCKVQYRRQDCSRSYRSL